MQLGIFAKTFPGSKPRPVLAAAQASGYDGVQFNMACAGLASMPDEIPDAVVRDVADAVRETGMTLFAVSGTYNMIHPDAAVRAEGHRRLEVLAQACAGLGTSVITLCTGSRDAQDQWRHHPDNATDVAWSDLLRSFEVALEIAESWNLSLGVEPEAANVVSSARLARRLIDELKTDRIGIILDPANLAERGTTEDFTGLIDEALDLIGANLIMAHAKDRTAAGAFCGPGRGVIDFDRFAGGLKAAGFTGPLVTHGLEPAEAPHVASFLRKCL